MKFLEKFGVPLLILIIVALGGWGTYFFDWDPFKIKEHKSEWWYRTILVTNEDGELHATPEDVVIGKEDMIRWQNPSRQDFRIEFENPEYPFTESRFPSARANKYQRPKADTPLDVFKYSVIFDSDTLDPIIKIEEEPPPGGDSAGVIPG